MRRRRFIVGMISLSTVSSGCLWLDSSEVSDDSSTTRTPNGSKSTQLNVLRVEQRTPVSDGSFTETERSTPLEANAFISMYEEILRSKDLQVEWASNVREETIEVLYPADDSNHEQLMNVFADAFIELTRRTGGSGWDMRFVVGTSGNVWYKWELTDDIAREYLHGQLSHEALLETIDKPDETTGRPQSETEPGTRGSNADTDESEDGADRDDGMDEGSDGEGEGNGDSDSGSVASGFAVRIRYEREWSGVVGGDEQTKSVDGTGMETIAIEDDHPVVISANAQKLDDSSETLTVQILEDGEVRKDVSTDAEYGVASVSYTP
ncbi:hypothetical protein [Halocatena salina]|uniref:Lipoprotein n=1 Tax=Halocatena salina TaxID=2934340 RepID=A0A8T9ZYV2_9EURY|nr:hypothetical protein [Halocatena salina]UPM41905.1 hypothetical protein MW046_07950 [Halocatena salina]